MDYEGLEPVDEVAVGECPHCHTIIKVVEMPKSHWLTPLVCGNCGGHLGVIDSVQLSVGGAWNSFHHSKQANLLSRN